MARRKRTAADPSRAIICLRVSTEEQALSGLGLEAQEAICRAEAARRGCTVVDVLTDAGVSGSIPPVARPGMAAAIEALDAGEAGILLVAKLDRATRSLAGLVELLERAKDGGWAIIAADMLVDTTTPMGRAMVNMAGVFAELERELIGQRTREALAVKRAQGHRLGRPVALPQDIRQRIVDERAAGRTLAAIADGLTADGVQTARGGRWAAGTVLAVLKSVDLDGMAA